MKKRLLLLLLPFILQASFYSYGQGWQKTYSGTLANDVELTPDGGFILAGTGVIKMSGSGNVQWAKTYSKGGFTSQLNSISLSNTGGYMVAGCIFNSSTGNTDVYVANLNSVGDTLWTRMIDFGGSVDRAYSIQCTQDGGCIVGGALDTGISLVFKLTSTGSISWSHSYGDCGYAYTNMTARSVRQEPDGNYLVEANMGTSSCNGNTVSVMLRLDASGNIMSPLDRKEIGFNTYFMDMELTPTAPGKGVILTGGNDLTGEGPYVLKVDSALNITWGNRYPVAGVVLKGTAVSQTSDGGYIVSGKTTANSNDLVLMRLNSTGVFQWAKQIGGIGSELPGYSVKQTSDGGFLAIGYTTSFGTGADLYVIKTDSTGECGGTCPGINLTMGTGVGPFMGGVRAMVKNPVVGNALGGGTIASISPATSIVCDNTLPVELISFLGETTKSNVTLKWITASENSNDYFTIERSADGVLFEIIGTEKGAGTSSSEHRYSFTDDFSRSINLSITKSLNNNITQSPNIYYRLKQTDFDGTAHFYAPISVTLLEISEITVYPNPVKDLLHLRMNDRSVQQIQIMDLLGQIVYETFSEQNSTDLNTIGLASGIYYLRVTSPENIILRKFMKE